MVFVNISSTVSSFVTFTTIVFVWSMCMCMCVWTGLFTQDSLNQVSCWQTCCSTVTREGTADIDNDMYMSCHEFYSCTPSIVCERECCFLNTITLLHLQLSILKFKYNILQYFSSHCVSFLESYIKTSESESDVNYVYT